MWGKGGRKRCFGASVGGVSVRKIPVHAGIWRNREISLRSSFDASVAIRAALPRSLLVAVFWRVGAGGRDVVLRMSQVKKNVRIPTLMDPPANPRLGLAGGRLLFVHQTLMARSGILAIRESFSSSLGRLGRQVRCGWWIVSGLIVGRCGDGHSHWHNHAEASAWVAAEAG